MERNYVTFALCIGLLETSRRVCRGMRLCLRLRRLSDSDSGPRSRPDSHHVKTRRRLKGVEFTAAEPGERNPTELTRTSPSITRSAAVLGLGLAKWSWSYVAAEFDGLLMHFLVCFTICSCRCDSVCLLLFFSLCQS